MTTISFSQNIAQWNFDDATPTTAMLPTTGTGTFTTIGGVVDNLTGGLMPAGNPSTGKAYSVKTFPTAGTLSGTAGFQFNVSTLGYNDIINVTFDPRGSNTASRFQQYEYSIDGGTTWTILSNNGGLLTNSFTANPMVTVVMPSNASNKSGFAFRIVSIFDPTGSDYSAVGYAATTPASYSAAGAWRIDNFTVSNGALVLSTNQNTKMGLIVYPNPVNNGLLNIQTTDNTVKNVVVYDLLGKQVLSTSTSNTVNVSSLKPGVYTMKITEDNNTGIMKIVIN
jgi:hypothetical protein